MTASSDGRTATAGKTKQSRTDAFPALVMTGTQTCPREEKGASSVVFTYSVAGLILLRLETVDPNTSVVFRIALGRMDAQN